nr:MAG TPA: hypothetical protein [Caudoviricetes sp.]
MLLVPNSIPTTAKDAILFKFKTILPYSTTDCILHHCIRKVHSYITFNQESYRCYSIVVVHFLFVLF